MPENRLQKRIKSVRIFIAAVMLIGALMLSSCTAAKQNNENQAPVIDPAKDATILPADNPEKNEDTIINTTEDNNADNVDVHYSISDNDENVVKAFDAVEDMQLGELKADMPKDEVEKVMKSELVDSTTREEYGMETEILTYEDGTVIHILDGKVYSISVKSPDYATPRGLKTGDTEETLKKLYGEPTAVEDGKWIYSYKGYDMFFVTVKDGIVEEIMISQVL